jgi:hypothetical protein
VSPSRVWSCAWCMKGVWCLITSMQLGDCEDSSGRGTLFKYSPFGHMALNVLKTISNLPVTILRIGRGSLSNFTPYDKYRLIVSSHIHITEASKLYGSHDSSKISKQMPQLHKRATLPSKRIRDSCAFTANPL